jgi:hypothetical protein
VEANDPMLWSKERSPLPKDTVETVPNLWIADLLIL